MSSVFAVHRLADGRWEIIAVDADRDQHRRPWCRVAVVNSPAVAERRLLPPARRQIECSCARVRR